MTPGTEAAVTDLARRDPALPALAQLLDARRLDDALGGAVHVTRRRWKRGADVVVAFDGPAGPGWIASYADPAKLDKTRERARRVGVVLREHPGLLAVSGPVRADRELSPSVRRLERLEPGLLERARLLRHNPHRRLVVAEASRVVKIVTPGAAASVVEVARVQRALADRGVPVLVPTVIGSGASSTPWWGDGDLTERRSELAAARAGTALARLHAVRGVPVPAGSGDEVATAVRALVDLVPGLAPRLERLASGLAGAGPRSAVVHGDFSADQVLVGDGVRLIDFDRVRADEPERDLGGLLAAEPPSSALGAALLEAYRTAGGAVDPAALRRRTASAVLLRAVEPFRTALPDWRERVEAALARAEGVLAC
ncbi:aminoglycoside phosphotransferase family protein [Rathayibacter sp. ZW T2_19]|uniref:Aminoglycoside phosphotransferase family protein n=1 Tax=Rathayibacter rubneri TaxID=2950106 RepID=A0A9X2IUN4_9MICO|nr:aminoglycoside phosphotransferase family protein [Rathayibacter rubneri]MCM6764292.1 aminoglycoside phosphotransferase family protein [Rathayibacter rubneri]